MGISISKTMPDLLNKVPLLRGSRADSVSAPPFYDQPTLIDLLPWDVSTNVVRLIILGGGYRNIAAAFELLRVGGQMRDVVVDQMRVWEHPCDPIIFFPDLLMFSRAVLMHTCNASGAQIQSHVRCSISGDRFFAVFRWIFPLSQLPSFIRSKFKSILHFEMCFFQLSHRSSILSTFLLNSGVIDHLDLQIKNAPSGTIRHLAERIHNIRSLKLSIFGSTGIDVGPFLKPLWLTAGKYRHSIHNIHVVDAADLLPECLSLDCANEINLVYTPATGLIWNENYATFLAFKFGGRVMKVWIESHCPFYKLLANN